VFPNPSLALQASMNRQCLSWGTSFFHVRSGAAGGGAKLKLATCALQPVTSP